MRQIENHAYDAGYDAYLEGLDEEDNPYDYDRQADEYDYWLEGFEQAIMDAN